MTCVRCFFLLFAILRSIHYFQVLLDPVAIGSLRADGKSIADMTALEVGNVGENIAVRRAVYLSAAGANQHLASYVHSTGITFICSYYILF